jgi:hypothetical protein
MLFQRHRSRRFALAAILIGAAGAGCDVTVESSVGVDQGAPPVDKLVRSPRPIPGRYIVVLEQPKDALSRDAVDVEALAHDVASGFAVEVDQVWGHSLHGFAGAMAEDEAKALA